MEITYVLFSHVQLDMDVDARNGGKITIYDLFLDKFFI